MNQKEIKELIELLVEKDITEFELERGDMKLHVKRGSSAAPVVHVAPVVTVAHDGTRSFGRSFSRLLHSRRLRHRHPLPIAADARPLHREVADRRHLLRGTFAGNAAVRQSGRCGERRPGAVHHRSHEADERNRGRGLRASSPKCSSANGSPVEYGMPLFGIRKQ